MTIPFLDLQHLHSSYEDDLVRASERVIRSGRFILGEELERFEEEFSKFVGADYCSGVGNGMDAITISLKSLINLGRLKLGDSVILPRNTFIATALSVIHAGLNPILAEPDPLTFNISSSSIKAVMNTNVKAIIVVHLYGRISDMDTISAFAHDNDLVLIEDAAQAHGAVFGDKAAGAWGHAGCFSFFPSKNIGCLGDGGAITTSDPDLHNEIKRVRNYGSLEKYVHDSVGINSRLDEMQAAFLRVKLSHYPKELEQKRAIATQYSNHINNNLIILPEHGRGGEHVFHLYVIRIKKREKLQNYLAEKGIQTLIHYPHAINEHKAFNAYFPGTYKSNDMQSEILSIPLNQGLSLPQQDFIIRAMNEFE